MTGVMRVMGRGRGGEGVGEAKSAAIRSHMSSLTCHTCHCSRVTRVNSPNGVQAIFSARQNYWLLLELAKLLVRLRQWGQALAALNKTLERPDAGSSGVEGLSIDVEA